MRCWIRGGALNALNVSATHILTSSLAFGQQFDLVWVETQTGWMVTCWLLHQFGTDGSSLDQQCNTSSLWSFHWRCSRVHCVLQRFRQSDDKSLSWEVILNCLLLRKAWIDINDQQSSYWISLIALKWFQCALWIWGEGGGFFSIYRESRLLGWRGNEVE